ncbi:hypothetical protein TNCV_400401 [Trichonephila clavipes]|nr:hypothetical protein TNCV_400401 [Trichonephila clavipes]
MARTGPASVIIIWGGIRVYWYTEHLALHFRGVGAHCSPIHQRLSSTISQQDNAQPHMARNVLYSPDRYASLDCLFPQCIASRNSRMVHACTTTGPGYTNHCCAK